MSRRNKELSYWYRPALGTGTNEGDETEEAFVFIHGVGFGPFPYLSQIEQWTGTAPVVIVELKAVTQRIGPPMPPDPNRFYEVLAAPQQRVLWNLCSNQCSGHGS